jgi:hypothetical protein
MNRKLMTAVLSGTMLTAASVYADEAKPTTAPVTEGPHVIILDAQDAASGAQQAQALQNALRNMAGAQALNMAGAEAVNRKTEKGAWLGVYTSPAPLTLRKQLKLKFGLVVDDVVAGSPADSAGLKPQDIITKLDDQMLINPAQLEGLIRMHAPGDSVALTVLHEGDHVTATAKLAEHEVLVSQDVDPQVIAAKVLGDVSSFGAPGSQMKIKVFRDDGKDAVALPPGGDGKISVMTSGSVTTKDDDGKISTFQSQFSDGKHQLIIIKKGDGHILTIKDADGKQLFEGPVDTTEQQAGIPGELLPKFKEMQNLENMTNDAAKP